MRKLLRTSVLATAATATVLSLAVVPSASAEDATWTSTPGGAVTGTNVGNLIGRNVTRGAIVSCSDAEASGTVKSGSGLDGTGIASVDTLRFGGYTGDPEICEGPSGLAVQIVVNDLPLELDAVSYNPTTGVTTGALTNADAGGITGKLIGLDDGCEADFVGANGQPGAIPGTFTNSTDRLATTSGGNLVATNVNGNCPSNFIQNGDVVALEGTFQLNSDQTLTSP
ncbi:hypothetical protein [Actinomadura sp. 6N118]|uniref:hypothetical protein n=1 Tax=Actinomadura sp. 6N118 TaxID=3375151 RepID=UPI0037ABF312